MIKKTKTGLELVKKVRTDAINKHLRTVELDVKNNPNKELAKMATCLIGAEFMEDADDFVPDNWDKDVVFILRHMSYKDRLIEAAALLIAEIDRLNHIQPEDGPKKATTSAAFIQAAAINW